MQMHEALGVILTQTTTPSHLFPKVHPLSEGLILGLLPASSSLGVNGNELCNQFTLTSHLLLHVRSFLAR